MGQPAAEEAEEATEVATAAAERAREPMAGGSMAAARCTGKSAGNPGQKGRTETESCGPDLHGSIRYRGATGDVLWCCHLGVSRRT